MVDLPQVPRRLALTEAPKTMVTAADIAQPYTDYGKALTNAGEALESVAMVSAEKSAQNAVTRDSQGNLTVSLMPEFTGKAGRYYNRLAKHDFLIQFEQETKTTLSDKQIEFAGRPEAFKEWFTTWQSETMQREPNNEILKAKTQITGRYGDQIHRSMVIDKHQLDVKRGNDSLNAQIERQADEVERLTRQGADQKITDSAMTEYNRLLDEKVKNPLIAYPKERADRDREVVVTRAQTGLILDTVERTYGKSPEEGGGYHAAVKQLNELVEKAGPTIKDAAKMRRDGLAWLSAQEKALQGDRTEVQRKWDAAKPNIESMSRESLDQLEEEAGLAGAWRTASDIRDRRAALAISKEFGRLSPEQKLGVAATGRVTPGPGLAELKTTSGHSIVVNQNAASAFQGFLKELEATGYKIKDIGGYSVRNIAGTNRPSQHSYGMAIDINPAQNPDTGPGGKLITDLPPNVGEIAAKYGIRWGGNFQSKKDAMHFEYIGGGAAPTGGAGVGGPVGAVIQEEFSRAGVDPVIGQRIAMLESSGDPNRVKGSYKGLFQLSDEEFKKHGGGNIFSDRDNARAAANKLKIEIDQFKKDYGRDPTPTDIYLQHNQGVAGTKAHYNNPEGVAWQNVRQYYSDAEAKRKGYADGEAYAKAAIWDNIPDNIKGRFGSVENVKSKDFVELWRGKVEGGARSEVAAPLTTPGRGEYAGVPGQPQRGVRMSVDLTQTRSGLIALDALKDELKKDLTQRINDFETADRKLAIPSVDEIEQMSGEVALLGTPAQINKVAELRAEAKIGAAFREMPDAQRNQIIAEENERIREGGERYDRSLRDKLVEADKKQDKAYTDDPYNAIVRYGHGKPLPQLDFTDPRQMQAVLAEKMKQQSEIRAREGRGPFTAFTPAESESARGFLANATPEQTRAFFTALRGLDNETLFQTLSNTDVQNGIRGAMRSTEPEKYRAVMDEVDAIYARDPDQMTKIIGKDDGWHDLKTYQSNLRYMSAEQLAKERAKALDPQVAEQKKQLVKEGEKLARAKKPQAVIDAFDTSWGIVPGPIARAAGWQATAPVDSDTQAAYMADYITQYGRRYAETQDANVAHEQTIEAMRHAGWDRSAANGGRLMLLTPENTMPAINGDTSWVKEQIETELTAKLGPREAGIGTVEGFWEYTLITDRRTEQEALRYDRTKPVSETNKPPTYTIAIKDNRKARKEWEPLREGQEHGRVVRFGFDPTAAQAKADQIQTERRTRFFETPLLNPTAPAPVTGAKLPVGQTLGTIVQQKYGETGAP